MLVIALAVLTDAKLSTSTFLSKGILLKDSLGTHIGTIFGRIYDLMHWFDWINFRGTKPIDLQSLYQLNSTIPGLILLLQDAKVLNAKSAHRHGHPAILVGVIMNVRSLTHFPAERHQLKEIVLKNQVASVLFLAEEGGKARGCFRPGDDL
jgi:hypothetical protein